MDNENLSKEGRKRGKENRSEKGQIGNDGKMTDLHITIAVIILSGLHPTK